jgi:hypothetical protein
MREGEDRRARTAAACDQEEQLNRVLVAPAGGGRRKGSGDGVALRRVWRGATMYQSHDPTEVVEDVSRAVDAPRAASRATL